MTTNFQQEIFYLNSKAMASTDLENSREILVQALALLDDGKFSQPIEHISELFCLTLLNLSRLFPIDSGILRNVLKASTQHPEILAEAHMEISSRSTDPVEARDHALTALKIAESALLSLSDSSRAGKLAEILSAACAALNLDDAALVVSSSLTQDDLRFALSRRESEAALKIQTIFRRRLAILKISRSCRAALLMHREKTAVQTIQAVCKSVLAWKFLRSKIDLTCERMRAATKIQSFIRGGCARKRISNAQVIERKIVYSAGQLKVVELRSLRFEYLGVNLSISIFYETSGPSAMRARPFFAKSNLQYLGFYQR